MGSWGGRIASSRTASLKTLSSKQPALTLWTELSLQTPSCHFYSVLSSLGVYGASEEIGKCIVFLAHCFALHRKLNAGETCRESSVQTTVWVVVACGHLRAFCINTLPPRLTSMHTLLWELPDFPVESTAIDRESVSPDHQSCQRTAQKPGHLGTKIKVWWGCWYWSLASYVSRYLILALDWSGCLNVSIHEGANCDAAQSLGMYITLQLPHDWCKAAVYWALQLQSLWLNEYLLILIACWLVSFRLRAPQLQGLNSPGEDIYRSGSNLALFQYFIIIIIVTQYHLSESLESTSISIGIS